MRRFVGRRLAAAFAVLAVLITIFAAVVDPVAGQDDQPADPPATGEPETPDDERAIEDLLGCVRGSQGLLVLFLMDESGSLRETDPNGRRVEAARGALDSLVDLASTGSSPPQVDVAMAAFGNGYRLVQDWTEASPATAEELGAALDQFADLNRGVDTDFPSALGGASETVSNRAAEVTAAGGASPCRVVLLFTDGQYVLGVRRTQEQRDELGITKPYAPGIEMTTEEQVAEVHRAGRAAMCDPGGLADQLRAEEVSLLVVALSSEVNRRAQLPLAAAAAGRADRYTCGDPDLARGSYVAAADLDLLLVRFNEVGTRLAGGNLVPREERTPICDGDPCDEGEVAFTLDATLRRAQLLVLPPEEGATVRIEGPSGASVELDGAGSADVDGVSVSARALAGRGLAIDLQRPDDPSAWTGEWRAWVVASGDLADQDAVIQVFVFSDIVATFETGGPAVRGEDLAVTVSIAVPDGTPVEDVVAEAVAEVRLRNPVTGEVAVVALEGPPTGPYTGTYAVPDDITSNALQASAEVRITTTGGAELVAPSTPQDLVVRRPGDAVQLAPGVLAFPSLTGEGSTVTDLILAGGDTDGCVWFGEPDLGVLPEGVDDVRFTIDGADLPGEGACVAVPAGQQVILEVQASPVGRGTGSIRGNLAVFERTESVEEASTTAVPLRFDLARGVDQTRRLLLAVALLALGLGIPLLALVIINSLTARFQRLDTVQAASIPVQVSQRSVSRMDAGYPKAFILRDGDFGSLAEAGTTRRFTFGGIVFRARASRNPFGEMVALAAPEGGAEKLKGREGSRVELDPSLAGSWVFLLDPDQTRRLPRGESAGQVIAFASEAKLAEDLATLAPDITGRVPHIAQHLAGLVRQAPPTPVKGKAKPADEVGGDLPEETTEETADSAPAPDPTEPATEAVEVADAPDPEADVAEREADQRGETEPPGVGGDDGEDPPAPPLGFSGGPRR